MEVIKLTYNWVSAGKEYDYENYCTAEISKEHYSEKKIVKEITELMPDGFGMPLSYLIRFEDSSALRVYNPNQAWYKKEV